MQENPAGFLIFCHVFKGVPDPFLRNYRRRHPLNSKWKRSDYLRLRYQKNAVKIQLISSSKLLALFNEQKLTLMQRQGLYFFFKNAEVNYHVYTRFTSSYGPKTQFRKGNADLCHTEGHTGKPSMHFQESQLLSK